jgi:prepilin-type N-terminal cleavage/methylation domain-containing protein
MKIAKKRKNSGFTLIEAMISSAILLMIMSAVYLLIERTQRTQSTEGRKLDMNQVARALEQTFYDNIRSAGAVLTILHTPALMDTRQVPFTGIYPLNNNDYPDGIIVASGDAIATTQLTAPFTPGDSDLNVITTLRIDKAFPVWKNNDIGMVVRPEGYYIFRVATDSTGGGAITETSLPIRSTAVYYSGLLQTGTSEDGNWLYDDLTDDYNTDGNKRGVDYTYPGDASSPGESSWVIRLNYFYIFLVSEDESGVRTLTITSDCGAGGAEVGDVLGNPDPANFRAIPIVPNIADLQIEYITKGDPPELWASASTGGLVVHPDPCDSGGECPDFINQFISRNIAAVRLHILLRTEEELEKHQGSGLTFSKPIMGDAPAETIPVGRFHYSYMSYEIFLRNFDIAF